MRCLLTADLHYALKQYDWLMDVAPHFDLVIIAGDHLDISSHVDGQAQMVVVLKYLARLRTMTRLITCSGNHDLDARTAEGEKTARWFAKIRAMGIAADGDSFEIGDMLLTICPWWDGPVTCAAVGEQLARDAEKAARHWGWIYHAPPAGSPTSWDGQRSYGDKELSRLDRRVPPGFRVQRARPHLAVLPGRLVGRPHRIDVGLQCRPRDRTDAGLRRARYRGAVGALALDARWEAARLDQATDAPVPKLAELPAVAHRRGSASRSDPGVKPPSC